MRSSVHYSRGRGKAPTYPPVRATDLPADIILPRLREVRSYGSQWSARCPAHADCTPSLSLTETDEGVLLIHCHAGCPPEDVLEAIGLKTKNLYPSLYAVQQSDRLGATVSAERWEGDDSIGPKDVSDAECERMQQLLLRWPATRDAINQLSRDWGLSRKAVKALRIGYRPDRSEWLLPEHDSRYRVVGIAIRKRDRSKSCLSKSVRGLILPVYDEPLPSGPVYLAEGASDTAALFSVGALAFGRPNAHANATQTHWLTELLRRFTHRKIIVVGDRDRAGIDGARSLARILQSRFERSVSWALPAKDYGDVRDQVIAGRWDAKLEIQEAGQ